MSDLHCACIEGLMTEGEHHESWCPFLRGDYDGLPRLDILEPPLDTEPAVEDD